MDELKRLQQIRAELAAKIKILADNQANWTAEDRQVWDKLNSDYDVNMAAMEVERKKVEDSATEREAIAQRLDSVNAYQDYQPPRNNRIGRDGARLDDLGGDGLGGTTDYRGENLTLALHGWLMNGSALAGSVTDRHRTAAQTVGNSLSAPIFTFNLNRDWQHVRANTRRFREAMNALSGEDGAAGGYTKDQTLVMSLELAMLAYGGVMGVAEVIRTSSGEPLRWPTADDTTNTGVQIGENTSHDSGSDPTFGAVMWNAYTFSSRIVKVPNELLQDSVFNLATELGRMLGERLGRVQNTKYSVGNGAGTAKGVVTCAYAGVTAASQTAIAFDELIDLEHSLDPSRRSMPGVGYMFHDNILKALRKLKDGEGRYLWQSGANSGAPDTLNTYPYTVNQDMASSIASAAVTMLFGHMPSYKVRQVGQVVLRRLDERFADTNQTGFLALIRGDGNLLDAGDHPIRKLTQA